MKLTLQTLDVGQGSLEILNANFALIATAFETTYSRDGTVPNQQEADMDMNSHRIYNLPFAGGDSEPVTLAQLTAMSTPVLYEPNPHTHFWIDITDKPTTFAPSAHTHAQGDITGLTTTLNGLDARLDSIELEPTVYVQAGQPSAPVTSDLWFW